MIIDLILTPEEAAFEGIYIAKAAQLLGISEKQISSYKIIRKSLDARQKKIFFNFQLFISTVDNPAKIQIQKIEYKNVEAKQEVVIVGAGPAGLFAALRLIELGYKPIIYERGKDVGARKKDIAILNSKGSINPDSNYCFGEGGAGAFSDGKLYSRSAKRGNISRILQILHEHGADKSILFEVYPHIGSDKLPGIIKNIRKTILNSGGQILFSSKVVDFLLNGNSISGIVINNNQNIAAKAVILATGHSARDIYELLSRKKISLELKLFAMGVRVEHPQEIINNIQYHGDKSKYLPPASYAFVKQIKNRGVYTFCVCPGGYIIPAVTGHDEIVLNGMSPSKRNSPFANAGVVVELRHEDLKEYTKYGPLAGLRLQQFAENKAFINSGESLSAPAQRMTDFINGKLSATLPKSSYHQGLVSSPLHEWLPESIRFRLQQAFQIFDKNRKGFLTNEAVVVGIESRTSSPVRIPRDSVSLQHPALQGLFPCGEGAGYAGGIISSAMDGEKAAEAVVKFLSNI
ncbi:MAG: NAD(P)/FAD-dependent oxidoreductase [Bacteroidia bacterium]|nr:NAD(P)/FAD-dependent oxidoreductase [Bacteroidia bacterium]